MNTMQQVDHKRTTKQEMYQKPISLKGRLKNCFPQNLNAFLYALFILVYVVCAIIHFAHTGNITMLTTLLPYISAYAGIDKVVSLFPGAGRRTSSRTED